MSLFKRKNSGQKAKDQAALAEATLKAIHDGVIMIDKNGRIEFINPAAVTMTDSGSHEKVIGLDYGLIVKLESKEGHELSEEENPLIRAVKTGQPLESFQGGLIVGEKRIPIAISVLPVEDLTGNRIITFRNIAKELKEEGEQTEFISTASHEMRTPIATIDGYLSLALNPQTATIDERARGYLTTAQIASKHLGKLFQDLLDATKLDDGRIRPHLEPVEMVGLAKMISDAHAARAKEAKINYTFGSNNPASVGGSRRLEQVVYGFVDTNFMREILDNLIDNAIKYTPAGGSIYVNTRGDGDRVLINVTDTGIGISAEDLSHIFQKFYRADNSDTRTIGGTGLGLYLAKQRVEAMGGKVWAESAFGEGSTFYVSLPRITSDEYEKRMIAVRQAKAEEQLAKASTITAQTPSLTSSQPTQPNPPQPPQPNPTQPLQPSPPQLSQPRPPYQLTTPSPPSQPPQVIPPKLQQSTASPPTPPLPQITSVKSQQFQPQQIQPQITNNLNLNGEVK